MGELVRVDAPRMPMLQASTVEQVLLQGDLERLRPEERMAYYGKVCESLGLNPLTRPFEYVRLNGKTILYAKRECTEQLRQIHNVSVRVMARETVEGCYVVTAQASLPNGRQDESIGAVSIEGLKGENRSNAMMKAETKAKRRVTLSICGLAFLDESESVPGAQHVPVDPQTGEIPEPAPAPTLHEDIANNPPKEPKASRGKGTTPFNALEAFAVLKKRFKAVQAESVYYDVLKRWGVEKSNQFAATDEGIAKARGAYKEMSLAVADLEAEWAQIPEVASLPDPVERTAGTKMRCRGKLWLVVDDGEMHRWHEVGA